MKSATYALLAVASAVWPLLVPADPFRGADVRARIGAATDLGARGRFDGVRQRRRAPAAVPELRSLARRSDEDLGRSRSVSALASAALVREAAGQTDAAIALLEEAAVTAGADAGVSTDLAALYLIRSTSPHARPGDAARALHRSGEALAMRPSDAALYNRAAALESLELVGLARRAWADYLERDRGSPWRADAQARLERLAERALPRHADIRQSLARMAETDPVQLSSAAGQEPMHARLLVEEDLLGRWARAERSGNLDDARRLLSNARTLAAAVRTRQGDGLLTQTVAAIEGAPPARRRTLAAGHLAYQDGVERAARDDWNAAATAFAESHRLLRDAGSPFAASALLQGGACAYYRPDYAAALAAFERVREEGGSHALLRARSLWLSGLVHFVTGRAFDALREHEEARAIFERAGERAHAAFLDSMLAADLQALGLREQAWASRSRALAGLAEMEDPRRVFSVLWEAARVCLDEDQPWAARAFLSEVTERRELADEPALLASTLVRRARIAQRVGDWPSAAADTAEVRRLVPRVPLAGRLEADLRVAEAEAAAARQPATAVHAYSDALTFLERAGNTLQSATLRRARAASHRALGDQEGAERDLESVLRSFEEGRLRLADENQRIAFFDLLGGVRDDLVALYLDTGRPWLALESAERARARSLLSRVAPATGPLADPGAIQARLPPASALVAYAVLPDRLVAWVVTPEKAEAHVRHTRAPDLDALVARAQRAIRSGAPAASREGLAQLHEALLGPAAPALAGVRTLFVVPDKALHRVPFAALVDRSSGRHLAEEMAVVSAPSAALLLRRSSGPAGPVRRVLVVVSDDEQAGWPALPSARDEGRRVAATYAEPRVMQGALATPRLVLEALRRAEVIHVAAHAVGARDPRLAGLLLRPDEGGHAVLTAEDLAALPGSGHPRVAVLASCQTAEGAASLEGPLSLARGFLALGTPAVIATLWDLPDAASARLVPGLHRRLASGLAPAEALREVQVEAIHAGGPDADPLGWAALVLVGTL